MDGSPVHVNSCHQLCTNEQLETTKAAEGWRRRCENASNKSRRCLATGGGEPRWRAAGGSLHNTRTTNNRTKNLSDAVGDGLTMSTCVALFTSCLCSQLTFPGAACVRAGGHDACSWACRRPGADAAHHRQSVPVSRQLTDDLNKIDRLTAGQTKLCRARETNNKPWTCSPGEFPNLLVVLVSL